MKGAWRELYAQQQQQQQQQQAAAPRSSAAQPQGAGPGTTAAPGALGRRMRLMEHLPRIWALLPTSLSDDTVAGEDRP